MDEKLDDLDDIVDDIFIRKVWHDEVLVDWSPSTTYSNESITDLSITFQIEEDESVYFLFVTRINTMQASSYCAGAFWFAIDGAIRNKPYVAAGSYNQNFYSQYIPVALQYSTDTLSAGSHTVTVIMEKRQSYAHIRHCTLLVQTYVV